MVNRSRAFRDIIAVTSVSRGNERNIVIVERHNEQNMVMIARNIE